jgi:hypothetical protein
VTFTHQQKYFSVIHTGGISIKIMTTCRHIKPVFDMTLSNSTFIPGKDEEVQHLFAALDSDFM